MIRAWPFLSLCILAVVGSSAFTTTQCRCEGPRENLYSRIPSTQRSQTSPSDKTSTVDSLVLDDNGYYVDTRDDVTILPGYEESCRENSSKKNKMPYYKKKGFSTRSTKKEKQGRASDSKSRSRGSSSGIRKKRTKSNTGAKSFSKKEKGGSRSNIRKNAKSSNDGIVASKEKQNDGRRHHVSERNRVRGLLEEHAAAHSEEKSKRMMGNSKRVSKLSYRSSDEEGHIVFPCPGSGTENPSTVEPFSGSPSVSPSLDFLTSSPSALSNTDPPGPSLPPDPNTPTDLPSTSSPTTIPSNTPGNFQPSVSPSTGTISPTISTTTATTLSPSAAFSNTNTDSPSSLPVTEVPTSNPTGDPTFSRLTPNPSPSPSSSPSQFEWEVLGSTMSFPATVCDARTSLDLSRDGFSLAVALSNSFDDVYNTTVLDFVHDDGQEEGTWVYSNLALFLGDVDDITGTSISQDGDFIALSQRLTGLVRVFNRVAGSLWRQVGDAFGGGPATQKTPVAVSNAGSTVAVAYPATDAPVRVFDYNATLDTWLLRGGVNVVDAANSESIALSQNGNVVAFSNLTFAPGVFEWTIQVHEWDETALTWTQRGASLDGTIFELSADGDRIAVGNEFRDFAFVYDWGNASRLWVEVGGPIPPLSNSVGNRVCLSGDGNVVGVESPASSEIQTFRLNSEDPPMWTEWGHRLDARTSGSSDSHCALNYNGTVLAFDEADCSVTVVTDTGVSATSAPTPLNHSETVRPSPSPGTAAPTTVPTDPPPISLPPLTSSPSASATFEWEILGASVPFSPTVCGSRSSLDLSADGLTLAVAFSNTFDEEYNATVLEYVDGGQGGMWLDGSLAPFLDGAEDVTALSITQEGDFIALSERSTGLVRVFGRVAGSSIWSQRGDAFGGGPATQKTPVAISTRGANVVVAYPTSGAPVQVYDYNTTSDTWLLRGGVNVVDAANSESVYISVKGDIVAFSNLTFAPGVFEWTIHVHEWNGTAWSQRGDSLNGTIFELSTEGDRIAVGNEYQDFVYVYDWNYSTRQWFQVGEPIPPLSDSVGNRVCLSGDGSVVGVASPAGEVIQTFRLSSVEPPRWSEFGKPIDARTSSSSDSHCALNYDGTVLAFNEIDCSVTVLTSSAMTTTTLSPTTMGAGPSLPPGSVAPTSVRTISPSPSSSPGPSQSLTNTFQWEMLGSTIQFTSNVCSARSSLDLSSDGFSLAVALSNSFDDVYKATVFELVPADQSWIEKSLSPFLGDVEDITAISIAQDGDFIALSQRSTGLVRVFESVDGSLWRQVGDAFGGGPTTQKTPVAISNAGSTVAVAYPATDAPVRVFDYNATLDAWLLRGGVNVVDGANSESIALSQNGNVVAFSNLTFAPGVFEWTIQIHEWDGTAWAQRGVSLDGTIFELSSEGDRIAVGNEFRDFVFVYDWDNASRLWVEVGGPIPPLSSSVGNRVCLSGDGSVVGVESPAGGEIQTFRLNSEDPPMWTEWGNRLDARTSGSSDSHCALNYDGTVLAFDEINCSVTVMTSTLV